MKRTVSASLFSVALAVATISIVGCGPEIRDYELADERTALLDAKQILEGYVAGNPYSSEADDFPRIVENLRAEDPAQAEIVAAAFDKIRANPSARETIAADALKQLGEAPAP